MYEENEKSIFNYNMLFNKINSDNLDEKIDYNTNLISDINLQNFDIKRYEYYTNLLYIYNKDPATLYNLLKKYYNIKNFKSKERKIIKYISNYARLLKDNPDPDDNNSDFAKKVADAAKAADAKAVSDDGGDKAADLESSGGGALGKYDALYTELKKIPNKIKRSDVLNKKEPYVEKGSFDTDTVDETTNNQEEEEEEKLLKLLKKEEDVDASVRPRHVQKADGAVEKENEHDEEKNDEEENNEKNENDEGGDRATDHYKEEETEEEKTHNSEITNYSTTSNLNQYEEHFKNILKIGMKLLQNYNSKISPQKAVDIETFKKDKLEKLNKFFQLFAETYKDFFEFKKNINDTDDLPTNYTIIFKPFTQGPVDKIINSTNLTVLNSIRPGNILMKKITYSNLIEFFQDFTKQNIITYLINFLHIEIFTHYQKIIKHYQNEVNKFIINNNNIINNTNIKKLWNIFQFFLIEIIDKRSSSNKDDKDIVKVQKIFFELLKKTNGGNLNDKLKIKYLDTRKYKDLKEKKDLDEYKDGKYHIEIDDDDDMNKIGQLSDDIDEYYKSEKPGKDKFIIQQINNFENDPKNPLEELAITFDDRIVFIIATFFIRYITIIMVQWCIDINIIKTFYEGFIYYAIIYIIIFWFIVLFINIDNSFDVKYMNFNGIINTIRTLFYYFYMGTNGITRLLIHTSLIILLIIIPIILNIKNNTEFKDENEDDDVKILNYDERKQLSKSLSLFTMFIWLFTSIIATKF